MLRGASSYGDYGGDTEDEREHWSHDEDIALENKRLKMEIARLRRQSRDSMAANASSMRQEQRRSTFTTLAHGRAQEQLREVIEENEHLNQSLKVKEREVEELRGDYAKLKQRFEEEERRLGKEDEADRENPRDIRLFKKKAQDIMKKIQAEKDQDLARADQNRKLLKMQLDDSQARCAKGKSEIVRLERELARAEAINMKKQASLDDLQHHYEEIRRMLEGERSTAEQLQAKVVLLEEELEAERMTRNERVHHGGETLEMLDRFMSSRRNSGDSAFGELSQLDIGHRHEPENCGHLQDHLADLQSECEQLRAQLALAEHAKAQERELARQGEELSAGQRQELTAERDELQRRLAAAEELREERDQLRAKLQTTEARLQEADAEQASLRTKLKAVQEQQQRRPATEERGCGDDGPPRDLQQECDVLKAKLAAIEEDLAAARQAQQAAAAEAETLRNAVARQEPEAPCSTCGWLRQQLSAAQELEQEMRKEREELKQQAADAHELEQEHRRNAEVLRQQLAESVKEEPVLSVPATQPASSSTEPAVAAEEVQFLTDERSELLRRNQELLEAMQVLQQRMEAAPPPAGNAAHAECVSELFAVQRECFQLRERLHKSKMAELDAQRKAEAIPELMSRLADLEKQVALAEKKAAEWREAAADTSWSGIFSSFMCAAPERRRHVPS